MRLPDGLHYIYGPYAMRKTDLSIINFTNLNKFLVEIQQQFGDGTIRKLYGDRLYSLMGAITRAHTGDVINPLTDQ